MPYADSEAAAVGKHHRIAAPTMGVCPPIPSDRFCISVATRVREKHLHDPSCWDGGCEHNPTPDTAT